jgi:hypothetical protein
MFRLATYVTAALSVLMFTLSASADIVSWMDFSSWDHAMVTGGGQTFENICDGVDVVVTGTPDHSRTSFVDADGAIRTGGDNNNHSFSFTFTAAVPVVVSVDSLDKWETINIINTGGGAVSYTHDRGSAPTESGDLTLVGTGVGQDPVLGAATGTLDLGLTSSFTWDYTANFNNKFERFKVGKLVVPEPASMSLACLVGVALIGARRRR